MLFKNRMKQPPEVDVPDVGEHIWHFFVEVTMIALPSRIDDSGCHRVPAQEWEALARLLGFEANTIEWGIVLAMDAKYCETFNSCIAHNRAAEERQRQKKK